MADYRAPLGDIEFVLEHIAGLRRIAAYPAFAGIEADTVKAVLEEAGRFAAEVVAPTNRSGDREGARLENGRVSTPKGFAEAYRRFVEGGWNGVGFAPEWGGGGLPWTVAIAVQEVMTSANMAFSLCPLLTQGAVDLLLHHADQAQQATYLPKMVSGEWTGTMNLTEPQAGSDVGALKTRAERRPDGTYTITGSKIFITYGEHDWAENIIHMVLARTPDAPPGTKGISCFIVPKYLVNPDGSLGAANDLRCLSLEHKLGIHASPTCVMAYGEQGGATGYLIGAENAGMKYMFTMMNNARLSVGLQGLAIAERAYQQALDYAKERRQGRPLRPGAAQGAPILEHADVRRTIMTMKAEIEAMRAVIYRNAAALDCARADPDGEAAARAQARADLLTPISKGWGTDLGVEIASMAVQVHGGMGFIEETGAAQHLRDARIAPIYEGTNGIQAMDLVLRKLPLEGGGAMRALVDEIGASAERAVASAALADVGQALRPAVAALASAADLVREIAARDPNGAAGRASPFLKQMGITLGGAFLAEEALIAADLLAAGAAKNGDFLKAKIVTARFYAAQILPQAAAHAAAVAAPDESLYEIPVAMLGA